MSTLGFTVLWRGVWTGHPQDDTIGGKECTGGGIVELMVVVTLDGFDGGEKNGQRGKVSDFTRKRKVHTK
jgi:hypothetical protein